MVAVQSIRSLAHFKTAARHWVPVTRSAYSKAYFSSRRVSSNNDSAHLVSNDDSFPATKSGVSTKTETQTSHKNNKDADQYFEPIVYSSEEITTASAVKKEGY